MLAFIVGRGFVNWRKLRETSHALDATNREHNGVLIALFSFAKGVSRNVAAFYFSNCSSTPTRRRETMQYFIF